MLVGENEANFGLQLQMKSEGPNHHHHHSWKEKYFGFLVLLVKNYIFLFKQI